MKLAAFFVVAAMCGYAYILCTPTYLYPYICWLYRLLPETPSPSARARALGLGRREHRQLGAEALGRRLSLGSRGSREASLSGVPNTYKIYIYPIRPTSEAPLPLIGGLRRVWHDTKARRRGTGAASAGARAAALAPAQTANPRASHAAHAPVATVAR
jgi:hypothetical protein